ncbi:MAG: (Fe-S)-binding protein, partial [Methanobacteriota archaeon]
MNPKVHLFIPCYVDQLYPKVGIATVEILESLGCTLVYPEQQTCCGQPFFNSGYWKETLPLAEQFLHLFSSAEYVVAPSGSCITMAKHMYGDLSLP